jgi:hypothetical protein
VEAEGELVLAVVRDGAVHRFDEGKVRVFQKDDRVVVIRQAKGDSTTPGQSPAQARGTV